MGTFYSQIRDKIDFWKKANESKHSDIKDYLCISFSDENSIFINEKDKVEIESYVIFILKYCVLYKDSIGRTWKNARYKIFYFTRHEYGDFFELDYIPLNNGWKLYFCENITERNSRLEYLTIIKADGSQARFDVDFKWDALDCGFTGMAKKHIIETFATILKKANSEE